MTPELTLIAVDDTLGYLHELFEQGDFIDLQFIHQTETIPGTDRKKTSDLFMRLADVNEQTLQTIHNYQASGWNSYVCMNALKPEADALDGKFHRRERDVANVRTVYIDLDQDAEAGVIAVCGDVDAGLVPVPHFIVRSSPKKFYVIWKVAGMSVLEAKSLNKALQQRYKADPQAVDAARVLRLIGTFNLKPEYAVETGAAPLVELDDYEYKKRVYTDSTEPRYTLDSFKIPVEVPKLVTRAAAPEKVAARMSYYEEACDHAGIEAGQLVQKSDGSFSYIVACPNVDEHTNGAGEYDASVWVSPSGALAFGCWHTHCAGKDWINFYRPWLEQQAQDNGYTQKLRFGDASEVEQDNASGAMELNQKPEERIELRRMTDIGNAERLVDVFGTDIRYCDETGKWLTWQEVKWVPTGKTGPQSLMQEVVRRIEEKAETVVMVDSNGIQNDNATAEMRRKMKAWAKRSESNNAVAGAIAQARGLRGIHVSMSAFDSDRMLLNVGNGTLNLRTRQFLPHRKADLITKVAAISFDQKATSPRWEAFLEKSMPDAATRRFLQQAVGYSLTGETGEDCLFLNIGNGRNGKGVFLNTLKHLLGDYALQANFDSFVASKSSGGLAVRTDIARMAGARFVSASENEQEARLAEGLLKTLTGSDTITARKLYEAEEEFLPQFKLWFAVNNEPRIIGVDDGIWSRIHLIMWKVFIRPEERDPKLKQYLIDNELPGILNWALRGLRDYQQNRLTPSPEMLEAGRTFRNTSDQVQRFFEEKCVLEDGAQTKAGDLYRVYKQWAQDTKEFQLKDRQFKHYLETRGFNQRRTNSDRYWVGVRLRSDISTISGGNNVSFKT
jgi:putative DNA primase/helicase